MAPQLQQEQLVQQDPLLAHLQNDVSRQNTKAIAQDAAAIIARDTDLSNPANTTKNLQRDASALISAGMSGETLEKLGILPKAHIEIPPDQDKGAVITDGKTSMPVNQSDVVTNIAAKDHGKPTESTVQDGPNKVTTYTFPDGWTAVKTEDSEGVSRTVEKSPDNKESNTIVSYPDGFNMIQANNADGTHSQLIQYPPTADGKVYEEFTDDKGNTRKLIENYHGIKDAPVLIDDDYSDVQAKYADRVQGEWRVMDYERRKSGVPAQQ